MAEEMRDFREFHTWEEFENGVYGGNTVRYKRTRMSSKWRTEAYSVMSNVFKQILAADLKRVLERYQFKLGPAIVDLTTSLKNYRSDKSGAVDIGLIGPLSSFPLFIAVSHNIYAVKNWAPGPIVILVPDQNGHSTNMPISINRTVRLGTLVKEGLSLHVRMEWDWAEFVNTNVNFAQIATIVNAHQPNVTVNSDNNSVDHSDSDAESDDQPEHEIIDISSDSDSDVEDSVSEETAPKRPKVEPNREVERPAVLLIEPNNSAEGEMPIVEEEIDNFFTHLNSVPNVVEQSAAQCEQPQGSRPQDPVPIGSREGGQMSPLSRYASVESDKVTSRKRPYVHQILPRGDVDERRRISVESDESDGEEIAEQIASVARAAKSHSERTRDEIRLINSFIEKMARSQVSRESGGSETECHPPSDPHQTDNSSVGSAQVANDCESQQQPTTTIDGKIGVESINEQFRMFVNSYSATMADYSAAITGVAKEFLHVTQTVLMKEGQPNAETNNAGPSGQ